ncbi:MAG: AIR synthase related protein [Candidatus Altiarchaeota archaeon]
MDYDIKRSIEHLLETNNVRRSLWHMDNKVEDLVYGIRQGDDSVVVGDMIFNMEGPYPLKTGRKTGLIHTCSDIVVMGGRPLFAFNAMQVDSMKEADEVIEDIKRQSNGLGVPMVGGNTQMENDLKPCVSFAVVGRLVGEPIADAGCVEGDSMLMLGEIVEGDIGERVYRAKVKYETFLEMLEEKVVVHAAKDASRGGWFGNMVEMLVKSRRGVKLKSIPYPEVSRYMGTFLISVPEVEVDRVVEIASKRKCPVVEVGEVLKDTHVVMGRKKLVNKKKMQELIRGIPYKKPKKA